MFFNPVGFFPSVAAMPPKRSITKRKPADVAEDLIESKKVKGNIKLSSHV